MTWFKVDDGSAFNAKVLAAGNEAWGAFCRVGAVCSQQLTDGYFSRALALTIAPKRIWARLIEVKLVDALDKGEMRIHDYLQRNPSKEQVLREREATKRRVNGFRNAVTSAVPTPLPTVGVAVLPSRPVPTRPDRERDAPPDEEPRSGVHRSAPPVAIESGYDLARRLWTEVWQAKYRRPYEFTTHTGLGSEDKVLQRVGGMALDRGDDAERYLRHKMGAYLRDHGDRGYLDEHCHSLRNLERDWVKYGEPKAPQRTVPRQVEQATAPVSAEAQAAYAKLAAGIGLAAMDDEAAEARKAAGG